MLDLKYALIAVISGVALAVPQNIQYHSSTDWKSKIKNVVVLVEENRSFDTFAGGLTYAKIDGLVHHNYCNSMQVPPLEDFS
jgi:phospholipase C